MAIADNEFLFRLESADPGEFAALLRDEKHQQELRDYFGAELQELRAMAALRRGPAPEKLGNVVVLHGILGAHLAEAGETIWLNPWSLLRGEFARLLPGAAKIKAQGLLKRYYGRQILAHSERWNVQAFAYDWRLSLDESAQALAAQIDKWFPSGVPVHLVAHSMGGLVARAFLALRPKHEGRLVMLGTPNRGSYSIPQLLHGMHSLLTPLALIDLHHTRDEVLAIIRAWAGVQEMDPANQRLARLPVDPARMIYIAGAGRSTAVGVRDTARLGERAGYEWSQEGDGTVPHCLGLLDGVPTYYADEEHGGLPGNPQVLEAIEEILETGSTKKLSKTPVVSRGEGLSASGEMAGFLSPRTATKASRIQVRRGELETASDVDAIVVAHYEGVAPHLMDSRPALRAMADRLPHALGEPFYIPATASEPPLLVMGLGPVGTLGENQLAILVRRLVWTASQFGIVHVAATLIGAGAGNLSASRAVRIWRDGLAGAGLRVTFFERDTDRAAELASCFDSAALLTASTSVVEPKAITKPEPIARLSMEQTRIGYRVALLTRDASIPEREIAIDHALVKEINAKLSDSREDASEWSECLRRLLLPAELQRAASQPGPVVVACDRATAQIHWEFLHPAVSRQFRSLRAPFRTSDRQVRRVLLVADTCEDAPLPGAAEEGRALRAWFAERNLEVKALIGPQHASRATVLRELLLRQYDILHFAGHCSYSAEDPGASGWVFTGGSLLSAREMERLDHVPAFIFSNACSSGRIAPSPSDVPSFAEALFGLGVSNLIATAHPVGDGAAAAFAVAFYGAADSPFHEAMLVGRAAAGVEAASWQHYGNPSTVLF